MLARTVPAWKESHNYLYHLMEMTSIEYFHLSYQSAAQEKVLDVKNKILDSASASLVPGEEFSVDNSVCSLKASKAFPQDVTDVSAGGSCVGNLGGAVGNDSSESVQMLVSPVFHVSLEKKL